MTEDDIRSSNSRDLTIDIYDGQLDSSILITSPSLAVTLLSSPNLTSTSGEIHVQSVSMQTSTNPQKLILTLIQKLTYDIWENDTISLNISDLFFTDGITCPPLNITVHPAAGIASGNVPSTLSEIDVNAKNITFTVTLQHDEFILPDVLLGATPSLGLHIVTSLPTSPGKQMEVKILQNDTYNIPSTFTEVVDLFFPKESVRSGIQPIVGDGIIVQYSLRISITGERASVQVSYGKNSNGVPSPSMWDGKGKVILLLTGDTWVPDASLWSHPDFGPTYTTTNNIQPYGFNMFVNTSRPAVTISPREAILEFPPMHGYTLTAGSLPAEYVEVARLNKLVHENVAVRPFKFTILKVEASDIYLTWGGPAFEKTVFESDIRKTGLQFTVSSTYDVIPSTINLVSVKSMFTNPGALSVSSVTFEIVNLTQLVISSPPQTSYDIQRDQILNLTLPSNLLATQSRIREPHAGIVIRTLTLAPKCAIEQSYQLNEDLVRSSSNVTFAVTIAAGDDEFCYSAEAESQLMGGISSSSGRLRFEVVVRQPRLMLLRIVQDPTYDLATSTDDFITLPIPTSILCSLEICRPIIPPPSNLPENALTLSVSRTPGKLYATFPTVTEADMRKNSVSVLLEVVGDSFLLNYFNPKFVIVGSSADANRGFKGSIQVNCLASVDTANASRATLLIPANSSYDIVAVETVTVELEPFLMSSQIRPINVAVAPLVVSPVQGIVVSQQRRNFTLDEELIIRGGFSFEIEVLYDRWNATLLPEVARQIIVTDPLANGGGISRNINSVLSAASFSYDRLGSVATITFQAAKDYDILRLEEFQITFSSSATASQIAPANATFIIRVSASPGRVTASGSALFTTVRQVLQGDLELVIAVENDLWVASDPLQRSDFCNISDCSLRLSNNRRKLTVTFTSNGDFYIRENTTFPIRLRSSYFVSAQPPLGNVSMFVMISAGILEFAFENTNIGVVASVTEAQVRDGTVPAMTILVDGDRFASADIMRASMAEVVQCQGTNDVFGFCSRASVLLGGVLFNVHPSQRRLDLRLQADDRYDIFVEELVTFRLNYRAVQSRLSPNHTEFVQLRITPTAGRYFISTTFGTSLSERDIAQRDVSRVINLILTLYGERWGANASLIAGRLVEGIRSDAAAREPKGFARYKNDILSADGVSLSDDGRVLTLRFMPVPIFDIFKDELITISVAPSCVLSSIPPEQSSVISSFSILAAGGLISIRPSLITSRQMRTQGVNLTLAISQDQWNSEVVMLFSTIDAAITSSRAPQAEPNGFSVYRNFVLAQLQKNGPLVNGTALLLKLLAAPRYDLYETEVLTIRVQSSWVTSKLPLQKNDYTLTITPEYRQLLALVYVPSNEKFHPHVWTDAVARSLGVPATYVVIEDFMREPMLPQLAEYYRLTFRVKTGRPDMPYDNKLAEYFMSMQGKVLLRSFNVVTAFYNETVPNDAFWKSLDPAAPQSTDAPDPPLDSNFVFIFAGVLALLLTAVAVTLKYRQGSMQSGIKRAKGERRRGLPLTNDEDTDDNDNGGTEMESERGKVAAAVTRRDENEVMAQRADSSALYQGQRKRMPVLHGGAPRSGVLALPDVDGNAFSGMTATSSSPVSMADLELPMLLYSGQRSQRPEKPSNISVFDSSFLERSNKDDSDFLSPARSLHAGAVYPQADRQHTSLFRTRSKFDARASHQ